MSVAPAEMYAHALSLMLRRAPSSKSGSPTIISSGMRSPGAAAARGAARAGSVARSTSPTTAAASRRVAMIPGAWMGSNAAVASRPASW